MADLNDLYDYLSDDSVVYFEPYQALSKSQCLQELDMRKDNPAFIAVELIEESKVIGNIYLKRSEADCINTYELGFIFNRHYQKKGYAKEASEAIMKHAFESLNAHRILSRCNTNNNNSSTLLENLNMRREAHRIKNMYFKSKADGRPEWFNSYQYAILADEWFRCLQTSKKKIVIRYIAVTITKRV